jgi:hypothetical protein
MSPSAPTLPTSSGTRVPGVGGAAWITCADKNAEIVSATPSSGYVLMELRSGPAKDVKVVFEARPRRTEIRASCQAGAVQAHVDER